MPINMSKIAEQVMKKKGIEVTKERLNSVVASMRVSGVNANDEKAVMACASVAIESSMRFDYSKVLNKKIPVKAKETPKVAPNLKFTGKDCPRCGKPMVLASIMNRDVSYCTNGCNIALPFPVGSK